MLNSGVAAVCTIEGYYTLNSSSFYGVIADLNES